MKKSFKTSIPIIICVALICSIIFSACSAPYVRTELSDTIKIKGDFVDLNTVFINPIKYETNNADYYFDNNIDKEKQENFVIFTEKILDCLGKDISIPVSFYILAETENYVEFEQGFAVIDIDACGSSEHIKTVLESAFGDTLHYGLLTSASEYINSLLNEKIYQSDIDMSDTLAFFEDENNRILLDMTLPCFMNAYFSQEQIDKVISLSNYFTDYLIETIGFDETLKLLINFDNTRYTILLNDFLNISGATYDYIGLNDFEYGEKQGCCIHIKTAHADYYMLKEYENSIYRNHLGINLIENYSQLCQSLETVEEEMTAVDGILKSTDYEYKPLTVIFFINKGFDYCSVDESRLYVSGLSSLLHEYVHYLTLDVYVDLAPDKTLCETIAVYYGCQSSFYVKAYAAGLWTRNPYYNKWLLSAEEYFGREIKPDNLEDLYLLFDYICTDHFSQKIEDVGYTYFQYTSFAQFLNREYGDDIILLFKEKESFYEKYDTDMSSLYDDWEEYLNSL